MAWFIAGLRAALAVYAAVYGVRAGVEDGVQIDISAQEAFLQRWSRHIGRYTYTGTGSRRDQRSFVAERRAGKRWVAVRNARWETVACLPGLDALVWDKWREPRARAERWFEIQPHFEQSMASHTRFDWFTAAAERGLICGPVRDLHEVLNSEQYAARGFFTTAGFDNDQVACPGLPFNWESSDRGGPSGVRHGPV
jgi:crotonobetainyl-CoA:carnitine CoA-transferase CaiB-like acyl-CoA transferase